jgi:hypothetical protein
MHALRERAAYTVQRFIERVHRTMKPGRGLLCGRRPRAVAVTDDLAIRRPKLTQALLQRGAAPVELGDHRCPHVSQRGDERLVEAEPIAFLSAAKVAHLESSNLQRPGAEIGAVLVVVKLLPEHDPRALKDIFGIRPVRQQRKDECLEIPFALVKQALEFRDLGGRRLGRAIRIVCRESLDTLHEQSLVSGAIRYLLLGNVLRTTFSYCSIMATRAVLPNMLS